MITKALSHFLEQLGAEWVLYILAFLFGLTLWVAIERMLFHRRNRVDMDRLTEALLGATVGGGDGARAVVSETPGMAGVVLRGLLDAHGQNVRALSDVLAASLGREQLRYNRYTSILGTIANNAPFIGLLGTVIGILNSFSQLGGVLEGEARTDLVMVSISEALVATAVGLAVAIPAVVIFNVLRNRTRRMATEVDAAARLLLTRLQGGAEGPGD